jgi:hypothetical protein
MSEEEKKDETEVQEDDPKSGLDKTQLDRIAGQGTSDHVHKLIDGAFTSGSIQLDTGGHVHTYKSQYGDDKRTSISEEHGKHTHETERGTTSLPE